MPLEIIRAGELRQIITIQRQGALDSYGNPSTEWIDEFTNVPAFVDQNSGLQAGPDRFWDPRVGNTQMLPTETHRITIRYLAGLDATRRVMWNGKVLAVLSVSDFRSRNIFMILSCQERVGVTS